MTQDKEKKASPRRVKKKKKISIFRLILVIILLTCFITAGAVGGLVLAAIKNAPKIDPTNIESLLSETSVILDQNGNLIEKIHSNQFRTIVSLDKIPKNLQNAFIAIEDERFKSHIGVDFKGIIAAFIDNIKAGETVRGASTITQQLARNLYLTNEKKLDRKIKEAYLAIQIEKQLTKDQILEAYLNTIPLGKGVYGVQEAAQAYFSKDVSELSLAECALIAGIAKATSTYTPYLRYLNPENVNEEDILGYVDVDGVRYTAVFNPKAVERQRIILKKMKELGCITDAEYNSALNEDMRAALKPGQTSAEGISSYFADYVKYQVLDVLEKKVGYTKEEAERLVYSGGLNIYSTLDLNLQKKIEDIYDNFGEMLFGDLSKYNTPILIDWSIDKYKNIIDNNNNIIYYNKTNLFNDNNNLIIENGTYRFSDEGSLVIKNNKLNLYPKTIDIQDYYTIDDKKNLVTHTVGSLSLSSENYSISKNKELIISNNFLNEHKDFYSIDSNNNLIISSNYFLNNDINGVVQPQSAAVVIDYTTGQIKALVGGRNVKGNKILNRATNSHRQPGSAIKPISVYLPALDNGFTAASIIDDIPHYDSNGNRWPKNWYEYKANKYWGLTTLRRSVEQSINVNAVKVLETIGIDTSIEYLTRMGIIDEEHPESDSFITRAENKKINDENYSSLALGGMSRGLTPLELTAAYGAIANRGIYIEPISFTKIVDKDGNIIYENNPNKTSVVSPQVAYLMTDILKSTVTSGLGNRAKLFPGNVNIPVAGKTGTTQDKADIWFVGYTPYYVTGVWIGSDSPQIKLSKGSSTAAQFWSIIMKEIHKDLPAKDFPVEDGFVTKQICTVSGKLATELCSKDPRGSQVRTEIFIKGTEPTEYCDAHVELDIDTSTNKIATEYCPDDLVEKKVFIKRDPPYNPDENNGIVPLDYQYTAPTEECDIHTKPEKSIFDDWLWNWFNNDEDTDVDKNQNNEDNNIIENNKEDEENNDNRN